MIHALTVTALLVSLVAQQGQTDNLPVSGLDGPQAAQPDYGKTVTLRGVDKTTGRVSTFDAAAGNVVQFGTLRIEAQTCHSAPPEEPPETTAFLEIDHVAVTGEVERVFSGWMFASSPAASALEHAVYDVWVINCKTSAPVESQGN